MWRIWLSTTQYPEGQSQNLKEFKLIDSSFIYKQLTKLSFNKQE